MGINKGKLIFPMVPHYAIFGNFSDFLRFGEILMGISMGKLISPMVPHYAFFGNFVSKIHISIDFFRICLKTLCKTSTMY